MKTKIIIGMFIGVALVLWFMGPVHTRFNGIVTVPDYSYAVAICGEPLLIGKGDETFQEKGYGLVVNEGHLGDPQVQQLKDMAKVKCAVLTEGKE